MVKGTIVMKTCKDCPHYEICKVFNNNIPEEYANIEFQCEGFTDRSEWVHLPCKVGDTIYCPWIFDGTCGIAVGEIESIKIYADNQPLFITKDWESDMPMQGTFVLADFGDIVFLDCDEAEKALERMKENE